MQDTRFSRGKKGRKQKFWNFEIFFSSKVEAMAGQLPPKIFLNSAHPFRLQSHFCEKNLEISKIRGKNFFPINPHKGYQGGPHTHGGYHHPTYYHYGNFGRPTPFHGVMYCFTLLSQGLLRFSTSSILKQFLILSVYNIVLVTK